MSWRQAFLWVLATALLPAPVHGQAREQFVPASFYWVGPHAGGGSGIAGGFLDYLEMLNRRDGGINGVKFTWQKSETEYDKGPTGATPIHPPSTGISYPIIERARADQAAAMVRYIAGEAGGVAKLRGLKVALIYHDSAYGKEPIPVLTDLAKKYGYALSTIPVPHPGVEQQSQWLQVREIRPDWVILWGWGVMNPTALKTAARVGYPRNRMVGVWWSGAEEDVIPAGNAAEGFVAAGFNVAGTDYPVIEAIRKHVYADGEGEMEDHSRIGSIYYNRGVVFGIITAEAVRVAQARFGKGRPVTGEQVQWALEHLDIDEKQLKRLGASGFMPTLRTSCADQAGAGVVRFMRWNGVRWNLLTDWMAPLEKEEGLAPRQCAAR